MEMSHGVATLENNLTVPLQYSCLENPMDGGAWQATVQGAANSQTQPSKFTSLHFTDGQEAHEKMKPMKTYSTSLILTKTKEVLAGKGVVDPLFPGMLPPATTVWILCGRE